MVMCSPSEFSTFMQTIFPATIMAANKEGHVMFPHFFPEGLRIKSAAYIEVPKTVVKPWTESVRNKRFYVFQQDFAP